MKTLDLDEILEVVIEECGMNPSKEFVEQEFLAAVREFASKEYRRKKRMRIR